MSSSVRWGLRPPRKVGHDVLFELKSTRWWFSNIFYFHPYLGEDFQFDSYFSKGLVQPPTSPGLQEHNNVSGYLLRFGQYIKQDTANVPSVGR